MLQFVSLTHALVHLLDARRLVIGRGHENVANARVLEPLGGQCLLFGQRQNEPHAQVAQRNDLLPITQAHSEAGHFSTRHLNLCKGQQAA